MAKTTYTLFVRDGAAYRRLKTYRSYKIAVKIAGDRQFCIQENRQEGAACGQKWNENHGRPASVWVQGPNGTESVLDME